VDVVKLSMKLIVDSPHMVIVSVVLQCFKDVSVFCENERTICVMWTVSGNVVY